MEHKLFLNKVDTDTLWKGELGLDNTSDRSGFYLKPFAMPMEKLIAYRQEIDLLVHEKQQKKQLKINPKS